MNKKKYIELKLKNILDNTENPEQRTKEQLVFEMQITRSYIDKMLVVLKEMECK